MNNQSAASPLGFNEWVQHINQELERTRAKLARIKEEKVPVYQLNTHSELRWSTKEALKPKHHDELNRKKKPKI